MNNLTLIPCIIYEQCLLNKTSNEKKEQRIKKDKLFWRQVLECILKVTLINYA